MKATYSRETESPRSVQRDVRRRDNSDPITWKELRDHMSGQKDSLKNGWRALVKHLKEGGPT